MSKKLFLILAVLTVWSVSVTSIWAQENVGGRMRDTINQAIDRAKNMRVPGRRAERIEPLNKKRKGQIFGNRRSQKYHRPNCPNYGLVSPKNRVPFSTEKAARDAGYKVAKNCP